MTGNKRIICIVLYVLLFTSSQLLFADCKNFNLVAVASEVTRIEYRIENDPWREVDLDTLQIQVPNVEADTILHLNLYGKKKKPIVTYDYRFDDTLGTWVHDEPMADVLEAAAIETPTDSVEAVSSPDTPPIHTDSAFFDLKAIASEVTRIEYRLGDESWHDVDMSTMQIQLPYSEDEATLLLNLYGKKKRPVVTYDYRFDDTLGTWIHHEPIAEIAVPEPSPKAEVAAESGEIVVPAVPIETDKLVLSSDSAFLDLKAIASEATRIEYSYEDESWHALDMSTMQIQLPCCEDETTLLLNLYRGSEMPVATVSEAEEVTASGFFDLRAIGEGATRIAYSYEDESWRDLDMESLQIELPYDEEERTLLLNLYLGSRKPIAIALEEEETVPLRDAMEVTLSPYATLMLTDDVLRHMYTLPFGIGLDASFTFPFCRNLVFKLDTEVKYATSNNIWAKSFILFGGDVGIGYRFQLPAGLQLTPALSYGLYLHHGLIESVLEKPLFFTHHVGLDVEVGYCIGPRMHLFAAPHVQMMIDTTRLGFLYGLRAGAGFLL